MANLIPFGKRDLAFRPFASSVFDDRFWQPFFGRDDFFNFSAFRVDIKDAKTHYELSAELPGVPQDQIDLHVENNVLTICADMNSERKQEREGYVCSERRVGKFSRSFSLEGVDENAITAKYDNGILTVNMPKLENAPEDKRRRIEIG